MSVERYIAELKAKPNPAETELYGSIDSEIMRDVLGYPMGRVRINQSQEDGIPDLTLISEHDEKWVICEVKVDDNHIRDDSRRLALWQEQCQKYIEPDTMYICLMGPRTIYVCNLHGEIVQGVHIEDDKLTNPKGLDAKALSDVTLRQMLSLISYEEACGQAKYEAFRLGKSISAKLSVEEENLGRFQVAISYAIEQLEPVLRDAWNDMQNVYQEYRKQAEEIEENQNIVGDDPKAQQRLINQLRAIALPVRDIVHIVEDDYPAFLHSQAYAGTTKDEQFLDIFITDTAYIIMSRILFVRICEDLGMVNPKVSHRGVAIWHEFFDNAPAAYRDLVSAAFDATKHVYSGLFERSVFDWWAHTNGALSAALERILYRLNAFEFGAITADVLGDLYQSFLPAAKRKQLGEFYTDVEIVDYILDRTGILSDNDIAQKRVLDPACGSFTFGVRVAQHLLRSGRAAGLGAADQIERVANVLVGFDVNPFAVFIAQVNLIFAILPLYHEVKQANPDYKLPPFQVHWLNSLVENERAGSEHAGSDLNQPAHLSEKYDYVVGNPPYVRNERVPEVDRESIETAFSTIKHKNTDLAAYFVYRAMKQWLKPKGTLGFVVSIGLANSSATRLMRDALREYTLSEVSSLEWIATELFEGTDVIPMLLFVKPEAPRSEHEVKLRQGLRTLNDLPSPMSAQTEGNSFVTRLRQTDWIKTSPTGDWCLETTQQDLPLLEHLRAVNTINGGNAGKAKFGIKAGSNGSKHILDWEACPDNKPIIPYCKGEAITTWGHSNASLLLPLSKMSEMSDPSVWARPTDTQVQGALAYEDSELPEEVVFVANIHPTLCACVARPREVAANNSAMVVVPSGLSAHALCAIINSRPSRYVAFLVFRSAILLRRRATWSPRTIDGLPFPTLATAEHEHLDELSRLAHQLSLDIDTSEQSIWAAKRATHEDTIRSAQLLNWTGWSTGNISAKMLQDATLSEGELRFSPRICITGDEPTLHLLLWSLQLDTSRHIQREEAMDIALPRELSLRHKIVDDITAFCSKHSDRKKHLHQVVEPRIDEIVLDGLGLDTRQQAILLERCNDFPLSETVGRPRYLWSEDRKQQPLRRYAEGERYR